MTTNSGPSLTDTQGALPMQTSLSKETGQEKSLETSSETEVQPGENPQTVLFDRQSNWDCGEMLTLEFLVIFPQRTKALKDNGTDILGM